MPLTSGAITFDSRMKRSTKCASGEDVADVDIDRAARARLRRTLRLRADFEDLAAPSAAALTPAFTFAVPAAAADAAFRAGSVDAGVALAHVLLFVAPLAPRFAGLADCGGRKGVVPSCRTGDGGGGEGGDTGDAEVVGAAAAAAVLFAFALAAFSLGLCWFWEAEERR